MKRALIVAGIMMSASVMAVPDYQSCNQDSSSDICQAYLAGLNQAKSAEETTAMVKNDSPFRSRALEQRVGERYRKMTSIEQKAPSTVE
ncbi:hypothetical protein [Photobacterium lutimaris]|uniref:Uncharacterized protein n=1 Tax=Photobacterium lutimaris TaxID=388278 RepID=A0A2T3IU44_9GAMM|nr:hypothetical protein [Photobacterium lutimaris]PSU31894.1 hypothetical protein C9I99_20550 [Photobacterium lutimaris]TDR73421.1 hypothetical protein DFP78_11168 [Photobacterium lutimaris]